MRLCGCGFVRIRYYRVVLACARVGAIHTVVFGGFAPDALRDRIERRLRSIAVIEPTDQQPHHTRSRAVREDVNNRQIGSMSWFVENSLEQRIVSGRHDDERLDKFVSLVMAKSFDRFL